MIPANSLTPVSKASCPEVGASLVSLVFEFSNNHLPSFSGPESQAQPGQPEQSQAQPEPIPTFPRNSRVFPGFPGVGLGGERLARKKKSIDFSQ